MVQTRVVEQDDGSVIELCLFVTNDGKQPAEEVPQDEEPTAPEVH